MKHVVWKEGASGPGIDQARAFLRSYFADLLGMAKRHGDAIDLPAQGAYDANLRSWVQQFQAIFNKSTSPSVRRARAKLGGSLPSNGDIDWRTRAVMGIDEALADDPAIHLPDAQAKQSPLTPLELATARPGERFIGMAYRIDGLDKLLAALGLTDQKVGHISDMRIAPFDDGYYMVPKDHPLYDAAADKSECAALVQAFGVPNTNRWRRGPHVQDIASLTPGTVIATLGTGVYLSDYSGMSHVGIFLGKTDKGLFMLDQYRGGDGKVGIRLKQFNAPHKITKVPPSEFLDPNFSYRMPVVEKDGSTSYARDYSLATVRLRVGITGDGSEYYVLLDDGSIARRDSNKDRLRTPEEERLAVRALINELFEGVNLGDPKAQAEMLRKACEGMKPPAPPSSAPGLR
jgi:hypothetical protein